MIRHECGLFGIYEHDDAARLAYFGLYAQQHRGQESAGIVTQDTDGVHEHKGMGLVPDVFTETSLRSLTGRTAVGHVRYSTTGRSSSCNAQPFLAHYKGRDIALAHNGNLVNAGELREELENEGAIFSTGNDTEVFMHLLVRALRRHNLPEAVREACSRVRGAYCLLVLAGSTLVAVRDPFGFHPLALGRLDGRPVFASETCAFDLLEAEYERSVEPGEMVIVDAEGERSEQLRGPLPEKPRQCIFELVYFARPDSYVFNEQVYLCRKQMGWQLAHESTPDVDFVLPFPDSGVYSAVGFAQCAELPYEHAMIRNHYVGRTFIQPTQSMRNFGVRVKINPVRAMIEGKRICIVDDSIVRGTTMITRVKKLRELGAKEVHIRISCPPVKYPCHYGIDFSSRGELIAAQCSLPEIVSRLDVDSLHYLSIDGLLRSVMHSDSYCLACFTGEYPVPCEECGKYRLEGVCGAR
ncbi:MAG: amidophosphoribosyltransferase [Desulfovibrio sp.]|uniref:Amidophosphoribosyltransferase n=1 Tax=Desulfovibrio porci TaxID=2605782 RepID=A0A6L5XMU4_9BACT|nr:MULTISPECIES: amidophosphoribosyltransferase [Desulfovibrio]MCD7983544.1 amidophosphoribosyltransferase [Desulfovibrio sp.]MDY3809425.1 amidophosphoribosyltransferase [Desulfovibrio porci]MSS28540.1 amidophosphoribosyltransferase [Desulfovibrio porci]